VRRRGELSRWRPLHDSTTQHTFVVSPRLHELRDLLSRNGILYDFYEPDTIHGRKLLESAGMSAVDLPLVVVLDTPLANPSNVEIADAFGVNTDSLRRTLDVAIVGAGPAGLGAAVYAASEGLEVLVVEREALGGQAGTSSQIRNFLGFPQESAERPSQRGLTSRPGCLVRASTSCVRSPACASAAPSIRWSFPTAPKLTSRAVLVTTGMTYRRLGIPSLERLNGAGVFYGAAISEAQALKGQRVFVTGGGNSAGQAVLHLADYADHVTLLVRGPSLAASMSEYLIKEIDATRKVEVKVGCEVVDGEGHGRLEALVILDRATGKRVWEPAAALVVLIGAAPRTDWLPPAIERDRWG